MGRPTEITRPPARSVGTVAQGEGERALVAPAGTFARHSRPVLALVELLLLSPVARLRPCARISEADDRAGRASLRAGRSGTARCERWCPPALCQPITSAACCIAGGRGPLLGPPVSVAAVRKRRAMSV